MKQPYIDLAPTYLPNSLASRYQGDGFSAHRADFAAEDVPMLEQLYYKTKSVYDVWLYMKDSPNYSLFKDNVEELASQEVRHLLQDFGKASYAKLEPQGGISDGFRQVIHDLRGGAMAALVGYAQYIQSEHAFDDSELMRSFVFLSRDQAKMMRNAVEDLDPLTRAADERFNVHSVRDYVQKWDKVSYEREGKPVNVDVDCSYEGNISTSCLEASAIDRVLYNYMNNAIDHSNNGKVKLTIFLVGDMVRWVVENTIDDAHNAWLEHNVADDYSQLFQSSLSSHAQGSHHGVGLKSCANLVAASAGLGPEDALMQGYLGATVINKVFYAWFHWPRC